MAYFGETYCASSVPGEVWALLTNEQKGVLADKVYQNLKTAIESTDYQQIADSFIQQSIKDICGKMDMRREIGDLDKIVVDVVKTALLKMKLTSIYPSGV